MHIVHPAKIIIVIAKESGKRLCCAASTLLAGVYYMLSQRTKKAMISWEAPSHKWLPPYGAIGQVATAVSVVILTVSVCRRERQSS